MPVGPAAPETRHIGENAEEEETLEPATGLNIIVAIGINEYEHYPALNNPINDAHAVLALFKQCGFQELPGVPSLVANDATRAAIAALPQKLRAELTADDSLVIFFAGHGEKREMQAPDPARPGKTYTHRIGYLIPVDGPQDSPGEWIKLGSFLEDISTLPARHVFVILDACKSGIALADKFKVKGEATPTGVASARNFPSRRVMTSARHNERAAEGGSGSGHSLFAEALIAAIQDRQADKDGDGFIMTWDLFSYMHSRVPDRARALFKLEQTPDYGYLPGDGSGDLVISLREGAFNRLIEEALGAMLRHDVPRLDELMTQLVAANPDYPVTLYLQFRLKFMQGDIQDAAKIARHLRDLNLPPGTLPLSKAELFELTFNLGDRMLEPLFSIPAGSPPIKTDLLSGSKLQDLHAAQVVPGPAGDVYQIESGALAQFQVTNLSDARMYLYYITVLPTGRLLLGPLLDPDRMRSAHLPSHRAGVGRAFRIRGLPGGVIETRILCSPVSITQLQSPQRYMSFAPTPLHDDRLLSQVRMLSVWYQIPEDEASTPTDVRAIEAAYAI